MVLARSAFVVSYEFSQSYLRIFAQIIDTFLLSTLNALDQREILQSWRLGLIWRRSNIVFSWIKNKFFFNTITQIVLIKIDTTGFHRTLMYDVTFQTALPAYHFSMKKWDIIMNLLGFEIWKVRSYKNIFFYEGSLAERSVHNFKAIYVEK